jgi:hypothetical protein
MVVAASRSLALALSTMSLACCRSSAVVCWLVWRAVVRWCRVASSACLSDLRLHGDTEKARAGDTKSEGHSVNQRGQTHAHTKARTEESCPLDHVRMGLGSVRCVGRLICVACYGVPVNEGTVVLNDAVLPLDQEQERGDLLTQRVVAVEGARREDIGGM